MSNEEWGPWAPHDDNGWPKGLEPDEIVMARLGVDILGPMPAANLDWNYPGDPVDAYCVRKPPADEKEVWRISRQPEREDV